MKALSFLTVFLLAGLFLVSFVDYAKAGNAGECVDQCKVNCDAAQYKISCEGLQKEERKECNTVSNILSGCCYIECLEETCAIVEDVPEESTVCEILDEFCGDPD